MLGAASVDVSGDFSGMDYDTMAADLIAQIPPFPELRERPFTSVIRAWETPTDSLCHTTYCQNFNEPWDLFLERCACFWTRCCAEKLIRTLKLSAEEHRALRDACWAKLVQPHMLPAYPDFWYGEPPPRVPATHGPRDEMNGRPNQS